METSFLATWEARGFCAIPTRTGMEERDVQSVAFPSLRVNGALRPCFKQLHQALSCQWPHSLYTSLPFLVTPLTALNIAWEQRG